MWQITIFMLCYLVVHINTKSLEDISKIELLSEERSGDPKTCMEEAAMKKIVLKRFGALPGVGWDNLRNTEAGMIASPTFTECRTTDDGLFLLPDDVFTVPIKYSNLEKLAEIIDNWQESTSATSKTINIEAGGAFGSFKIGGKFSYEHSEIKTNQYRDQAVTIRVKLQYVRYEAKLQPDPQLSPQFKKRLLHIADNLEQDRRKQARYEAQLLIREFGTHILTSISAGAALIKDDYLKKTFVEDASVTRTDILAQASVSFGSLFNASASYGSGVSDAVKKGYANALTQSYVKTYGGPLFLPEQTSLDKWANDVDINIVPMDRDGEPLNFLINSQALPELEPALVVDLEGVIRQAISTYYEMNVIRGCTKPDAPNFSLAANVDDGMCQRLQRNSTFGGIYKTCSITGSYMNNNPCAGMAQDNPKTGRATCPSAFFAVRIFTETKSSNPEMEKTNCRRCGFLWLKTCCKETIHVAVAHTSTYWCAQSKDAQTMSGYMFGGLFTSTSINPFTGLRKCPSHFSELDMTSELKICLCDDTELCSQSAIPFGGFFRCDMGNPQAATSLPSGVSGEGNWPKGCPDGHSQHLVVNDDGCSVHYCSRTGSLSGTSLPPVRRPPFMKQPKYAMKNEDLDMVQVDTKSKVENGTAELTMTVYGKPSESPKRTSIAAQFVLGKKAKRTLAVRTAYQKLQEDESQAIDEPQIHEDDTSDELSSAEIGGMVAGIIFSLLVIVLVVVFAVRYRRRRKRRSYENISEHTSLAQTTQGSTHI